MLRLRSPFVLSLAIAAGGASAVLLASGVAASASSVESSVGAGVASASEHAGHHADATEGAAVVTMHDDCDPVTFNAADIPCVGDGETTLNALVGQLLATKNAPEWRFAPTALTVETGKAVAARNRGGEAHSFTEVAAFGGGCVDALNGLLGLTPVPECASPANFPGTIVGPGGSISAGQLAPGVHRFECLIHPWMRTVVTVKAH